MYIAVLDMYIYVGLKHVFSSILIIFSNHVTIKYYQSRETYLQLMHYPYYTYIHIKVTNWKFYTSLHCLCIEICQDVKSITKGNVTYTGHLVGDAVKYQCHTGYTVHGPVIRYCLQSGKWTKKSPKCQSK